MSPLKLRDLELHMKKIKVLPVNRYLEYARDTNTIYTVEEDGDLVDEYNIMANDYELEDKMNNYDSLDLLFAFNKIAGTFVTAQQILGVLNSDTIEYDGILIERR